MQLFSNIVYTITQKIPKGKVATYGQIAELSGNPHAARAVGLCMKNNPQEYFIPCHRVVSANGKLTGYAFGGVEKKKQLLSEEGVMFIGERVNLAKSQWQPTYE